MAAADALHWYSTCIVTGRVLCLIRGEVGNEVQIYSGNFRNDDRGSGCGMGAERGRFGSLFEAVAEYCDAAGAKRSGFFGFVFFSIFFPVWRSGFDGPRNGAEYGRCGRNESAFA